MEQYRQTDVNFWGIVAISAMGLAMVLANLPALVSPDILAGLHTNRLDGGTLNSLRAQVARLERDAASLRLENSSIQTRFSLTEQTQGSVAKRLGALENTLPVLLEQIPPGAAIDTSTLTSAISRGATQTQAATGGSVEYSTTPLYPDQEPMPKPLEAKPNQPTPSDITSAPMATPATYTKPAPDLAMITTDGFGMAMGPDVTLQDAHIAWADIRNKAGALLIGFEPLLAVQADGTYHLVAGPVKEISRATEICRYATRAGVQCLPMPYSGYRLPQ